MKKITTITAFLLVLVSLLTGAYAASSSVEDIEYEGNGRVDVELRYNVKYKNAKVTVKDGSGKKYSASITHKDEDDVRFKVKNIKAGKKYTFSISGVYRRKNGKKITVSGSFRTPAANKHGGKVSIKNIKYEADDGTIDVEFASKVSYNNSSVTVKDGSGKSYSVSFVDRDNDDIEVYVGSLPAGKKYTVTVSGVAPKGSSSYGSVSGTFSTPKAGGSKGVSISSVDSDAEDDEIDVKFNTRVTYNNLKVTVKDSSGNKLSAHVTDMDDDDIEVYVSGLTYGRSYTVTVSGVAASGSSNYVTVSRSFTAR